MIPRGPVAVACRVWLTPVSVFVTVIAASVTRAPPPSVTVPTSVAGSS
jgi:hypothetical protein